MKGLISIASLLLTGLIYTSAEISETNSKQEICPDGNSLNVLLEHETDCTFFYACQNGKKTLRRCPLIDNEDRRLHFNSQLQACDSPEKVKCPKLLRSNDDEDDTSDWKNPKNCIGKCPVRDPQDHSVLLRHKDCSKYCICGNGKATVNVCPPRLHFSLSQQVCTWPYDAQCDEKDNNFDNENREEVFSESAIQSGENPNTCKNTCPPVDPIDHVILLENEDCTKFCMCHAGTPHVKDCPSNLHFSLKHQVCTWPQIANCPQIP